MTASKSIALRAYHAPDGRCIHYAAACLRKEAGASIGATFVNVDADVIGRVNTCWVIFYPAGPNRRLLELILARYAPNFDCDKDVLFLCINRPGKGGTSGSHSISNDEDVSPEQQHVNTTCQDVVTILDYYQIPKTSLFYMCAGSTFCYSFAARYSDRSTGCIIGVSSWILRSCPSQAEEKRSEDHAELPPIHSFTHRMAMNGLFGPKWFVSNLASGSMSNVHGLFGLLPPTFIVNHFKKTLSLHERNDFDEHYSDRGGVGLIEDLMWMNQDGSDGEGSLFVNSKDVNITNTATNTYDGNAKDISVCLTTQEELGLVYDTSMPTQRQVLLWHGTKDHMISVAGAEYLASQIPHATLNKVTEGTHQGTMFFFPDSVMIALNSISSEV
ncbi:hypothetical protein HJC23_007519 [Cyclotella cryptica]|uniref:AB hydrolase-1 domain-containing protein n=1 Tax=Cyclotella cryptica TaxID=29204 RepID=A0ABD3PVI9_9STRA